MTTKTYQGSCHCKQVTFTADIDLAQGTSKCNCTSCWKRRLWGVRADPATFRALTGADQLSDKGFCKGCGVLTYRHIPKADWNPSAYVSISVASLDDLDPAALVEAPVQYADGLHDNWWNPPAENRHL